MATTTGNEAYEARARLTLQVSQGEKQAIRREAKGEGGKGEEGGGEGGGGGRGRDRVRPGPPPTPPQEDEFRRRTFQSLGESLKSTAQTVLKLRKEEFSSATCALIHSVYTDAERACGEGEDAHSGVRDAHKSARKRKGKLSAEGQQLGPGGRRPPSTT